MDKAKWNYVFGAITIGVIIGGTVYAIKKSKEAEKVEEEAISLDEARELVKQREKDGKGTQLVGLKPSLAEVDEIHFKTEEFEEVDIDEDEDDDEEEERKFVHYPSEDDLLEDVEIDDVDYEDVDELIEGPSIPTVEPLNNFNYFEEGIDPKEDKTLRHDSNSIEAKHQFIRMELADWQPDHDIYRIMLQLFEFPFVPFNDGDEMVRTQIVDYKAQFFGDHSKWIHEVSYADLVFHYARLSEFNVGEDVQYWVEFFIDNTDIHWDSSSHHIDTVVQQMNAHSYFNEERQSFGLFGLSRNSMDHAIQVASGNVDSSVTYDIEFNEFLKSNF